jgi:hypothetical protein
MVLSMGVAGSLASRKAIVEFQGTGAGGAELREAFLMSNAWLSSEPQPDHAVEARLTMGSTGVHACSGGRPARRPTERNDLSIW